MAEIDAGAGGGSEPSSSSSSRPRLLAILVAGSMFMAQLDGTIVATALPRMAADFHTPATNLSIGISLYLLAQVIFLPASSWVSDRLGARRTFAGAMLAFTVASILCGLSGTVTQFAAARVLQGSAAALMTPVGRVVLVRTTRKAELVKVLTITSMPMLLAPTLGPPVGGFVVTFLSWPWVFFLNVPVGVACLLLILRIVPDLSAARRPFDLAGFVLTGAGLAGLIFGLDRITAPGVPRAVPLAMLAGGLLSSAVAIRHARRAPHPLLSLAPLRYPTFRIPALGGGFFARLPIRALPFVLPLSFQIGLGLSAFASGMMVMGMGAADLAAKPFVQPILRATGFRAALIATSWIATLATVAMAAAGLVPLALVVVAILVSGAARSVLFSGLSSLLYADVPEAETGAATVLWNVVQQATNAVAVSFTVIGLNLVTALHGGYGVRPSIADFRITLLFLAMLGLPALWSFARLPGDAGGELSGHRRRGSLPG